MSIGAHPSFHDIQGFGRRRVHMSAREIECMVAYQIGALAGIAAAAGAKVTHVKPHGALNNMAHEDPAYATAIARAIRAVDRDLIFVANACSEMVKAGHREGVRVAEEAYADRLYEDDGRLASRALPDAMITEPERAIRQVTTFIEERAIVSRNGVKLPARSISRRTGFSSIRRLPKVMASAGRHAEGRAVSLLEGGYALSALGRSAVQHLKVLAGLNA